MDERRTYPYVSDRVWWALRRQFRSSPPRGAVDASYLSTVLDIDERSARNIVPNLRRIGLIDDAGRVSELAMAWRDDDQYVSATREMVDRVYPESLRDALPPPDPSLDAARRWFARDTGGGEANSRKLAAFYVLMASGDLGRGDDTTGRSVRSPREAGAGRSKTSAAAKSSARARRTPAPSRNPDGHGLVLNLHIHLDGVDRQEVVALIDELLDRSGSGEQLVVQEE